MQHHPRFDYGTLKELVSSGELLPIPKMPDIEGTVAVYNPSARLTIGEESYVWARVESDTALEYLGNTEIRLFRSRDSEEGMKLDLVVEAPVLCGEDPSFMRIGDKYFVGIVELDEQTHQPTTIFFNYDPEALSCTEYLRGPAGQKDVRLAAVNPSDPEKGFVMYGRPDFGNDRRRITRVFISGLDDPELEQKMAYLGSEEAVIGEELFAPYVDEKGGVHPTWGGVNYVTYITSESGKTYRVLGAHYAYYTDTDETTLGGDRPRHYEGMLLLDTGTTLVKLCTLGTRSDFPHANPKGGREDLDDVSFLGGGSDGQLEGDWMFGLGDSRIGVLRIPEAEAERIRQKALLELEPFVLAA